MSDTWTESTGNVVEAELYYHVETQSERFARLSDALADIFASVCEGRQSPTTLSDVVEAADALAHAAVLIRAVEMLPNFDDQLSWVQTYTTCSGSTDSRGGE